MIKEYEALSKDLAPIYNATKQEICCPDGKRRSLAPFEVVDMKMEVILLGLREVYRSSEKTMCTLCLACREGSACRVVVSTVLCGDKCWAGFFNQNVCFFFCFFFLSKMFVWRPSSCCNRGWRGRGGGDGSLGMQKNEKIIFFLRIREVIKCE